MLDFLKIVIYDDILCSLIWNNELLEYDSEETRRISHDELRNTIKKKFKNLKFIKLHNRLEITGSLHYYFNNGIHNANDFTVNDCINTIKNLEQILELELNKCFVVNLEFGVNVIPCSSIKEVIPSIEFHGRNGFRYLPELKYAKQSASFNKDSKVNWYKIIKAYAKGLQEFDGKYYCDGNAFRFEVKSKKSRYINNLGIKTLADLLDYSIYQTLALEIKREWNEVLVLDQQIKLNQNEAKYSNPKFWERILNDYRNGFSYHKKCYSEILKNHPKNIHATIREQIGNKLDELLKISAISPPLPIDILVQFHQYIRGESAPVVNKRTCPITKVDISMQKENSHLLSNTGLTWLKQNDPAKYEIIRRCYLPTWGVSGLHTKFEDDEISHLSKQIRNEYYNRRRNWEKIPANQLQLL